MADFVFPQPDVGEFEAPNGLTYTHDGQKWRVKFLPGGAPIGKEGKPWLEISAFNTTYNNRTAWGPAWVYTVWWNCNGNCTYTWQYEVDINGDGDWIDIADHAKRRTGLLQRWRTACKPDSSGEVSTVEVSKFIDPFSSDR